MKLTATTLSTAQLPAGKSERILFDDVIPGFGLRVREGASRTFVFQYTLGTKQRRMSLGVATETNVNNVRKIAEKLHARVKLGEDPATTKAQGRASAMHTFRVVAEEYLEHHKSGWRPRTYTNDVRNLFTYAKALHQLQLDKITRADIAAVHGSVTRSAGAPSANRVRSSLSGLFTWVIENGNDLVTGGEQAVGVFSIGVLMRVLMQTNRAPAGLTGGRWEAGRLQVDRSYCKIKH
jgi:hypothetical protein